MPNTISLLPSSLPSVTHDPTATLNGDPMGVMGKNPFGEMTSELLFGAVNTLLGWIDDATGLDLLGMVSPLESLLGGSTGLLSGLLGFLTPGSSTAGGGVLGPLLNLIPGLGGGSGTLGGLGSFLNPTSLLGAAAGIFGPLLGGGSGTGTFLGGLIPGLDASKITSGTFGSGVLQPFIDAVSTGFGGSTGLGIPGLSTFLSGLSLVGVAFDDIINIIPGIGGGLTGATGLGSIFTDLFGMLGSPTGVGTGSPILPGIGSIPILGGLLSGGTTLLGSLIPGLDASKIISGLFPISQITNLSTLLGGFGTGTSIISQLIGVIPGLAGGLTGLGGLGSIFTDLTGLLGAPTALGSGSPTLPGIGSIPILGGLLSGGNILGSLIPGLDASKIISGLFPISQITNLSTLLGGFGTGTSIISQLIGVIPGLAGGLTGLGGLGSIFTDLTGLLGAPTALGSGAPALPGIGSIPILGGLLSGGNILGSIIPGLDASKIISGLFPISQITNLSTLLGGFGTGTSILTQLIGVIPGLTGGLTGLGGLGSIFTDLTHILGSPTALGSGTPVLPGIGSIPVLGGLLSGGNILGSLIPSLDASKITSGVLGTGVIPTLGRSLIPDLQSTIDQFITGWTGTTTTNAAPSAMNTSGSQIHTAVYQGYTVVIFSASNAAWLVPSGVQKMLGGVINGGGKGGTATLTAGGVGGNSGGYLSKQLDMTGITPGTSTLNIIVGAGQTVAGAAPAQNNGGASSILFGATHLLDGVANANGIAMDSGQGWSASASVPGAGGVGGFNTAATVAGSAGGDSAVATGGVGGTAQGGGGGTGGTGGTGGAGTTATAPVCGGGGGGGGGESWNGTALTTQVGGAGGPGGSPGGGGGGGGSAQASGGGTRTQGVGGNGANGLVVVLYK